MTDPHPPDKVGDGIAPGDGDVDAQHANAAIEQPGGRDDKEAGAYQRHRECEIPEERSFAGEHQRGDLVGDRAECFAGCDDGERRAGLRLSPGLSLPLFYGGHVCSFSRSGLGLRNSARYVVRGRVFNSASNA